MPETFVRQGFSVRGGIYEGRESSETLNEERGAALSWRGMMVHGRPQLLKRQPEAAVCMRMNPRYTDRRPALVPASLAVGVCMLALFAGGPASARQPTQNKRLLQLVRYPTAVERAGLLRAIRVYVDRPSESYQGIRVIGVCVSRAHPRMAELNAIERHGSGSLTPIYRTGKLRWVVRAAPKRFSAASGHLIEATTSAPCGYTTKRTFHPAGR
jgi:hypothetical protein